MKAIIQYISLGLVLTLVTSCNKVDIPEPNENVEVTVSHALFVNGVFDGVETSIIVDGETFAGYSYLYESGSLGEWCFDIYNPNNDTTGIPHLSFRILNHEQSATADYQDLVLSTSSPTIDFVDAGLPYETQYDRIVLLYFPNEQDFYASDLSNNTALDVIEAKDTLVGDVQYRLLEVTGSINLTNVSTLDEISIDNFHARLAFGL